MARITINTKVSVDLEEMFSALRDTYSQEQLARIAVRMGTTKFNEYDFAQLLLAEASKVVMRKFSDEESREVNAEYYLALKRVSDPIC